MIRYLLAIVAIMATSTHVVHSAIYKHVDEQGRVTYTDTPRADTSNKQVELPPINQQPPTPLPPPPPVDNASTSPQPDYQITLSNPSADVHLNAGQRDLEINVIVAPPLAPGMTLQALLDGKPFGPASRSSSWTLTNIYRGEHQLRVELRNAEGELLSTSKEVNVTAFRPTVAR